MTRKEIMNELERLAVSGKWSQKFSRQALYEATEMLDNCECGEVD